MSEKLLGYKSEALKALIEAKAEIGDLIRVTKNGDTFEGILIPRSEYGDDRHIVIKIKSGYNIGIKATPTIRIEKICASSPTDTETKPAQCDDHQHWGNHSLQSGLQNWRCSTSNLGKRPIQHRPGTLRHSGD